VSVAPECEAWSRFPARPRNFMIDMTKNSTCRMTASGFTSGTAGMESGLLNRSLRKYSGESHSPPQREGWTRHQEEVAKPPLMERTGWSEGRDLKTARSERFRESRPPRLRR